MDLSVGGPAGRWRPYLSGHLGSPGTRYIDMTIDPLWRHISVRRSDSPLEGPVRGAFRVLWSCIPDRDAVSGSSQGPRLWPADTPDRTKSSGWRRKRVDIGAHEGEILKWLVRLSPGPHWAFEPIPACAARLRRRFPDVTVEQAALSKLQRDRRVPFPAKSSRIQQL